MQGFGNKMSKRIGYIDGMRGFTMILVVYSHICTFCLGDSNIAFNDVLFLFRLPCFFFISGWLFYGVGREWTGQEATNVMKKKFMVQIVPTLIFLFLLSPPPAYFHQFGAVKGGYWFTFALFVFFILYIISILPLRLCQGKKADIIMLLVAFVISMTAYWYDINYYRLSYMLTWQKDILGFLSFITWRYYLFFCLGTLARKYFPQFLKITGNGIVMAVITLVFFAISQIPQSDIFIREYFKFSVGGIMGMTIIFALFRYLYTSSLLSIGHPTSAIIHPTSAFLKFVGTRTLDIYLLHYFFLPRFLLSNVTDVIPSIPSLLLPVVILLVSLAVVAFCLATSYIIRLSPFLGHYLFGVKYERLKDNR